MKYEPNQWHIIFQKSMNIKQTRYDNTIPLFGVCFLVMLCQEPITISNAVHVSNGYQNGSQTLYSCIQGYAGNIGNRITTCNGTHWSNTTLTCGEQIKMFLYGQKLRSITLHLYFITDVLFKGDGSEPIVL